MALAEDMADVIRGCTVPEWVVLRAISKHHRRKARTSDAEIEAAHRAAYERATAKDAAAYSGADTMHTSLDDEEEHEELFPVGPGIYFQNP